jgi:hypothetical protein
MQQGAPVDNENNLLTRADSMRRADLPLLVDGVLPCAKFPRLRIMSRPCCDACDSEMWLVSIEPDDKCLLLGGKAEGETDGACAQKAGLERNPAPPRKKTAVMDERRSE